jgi:hypothetical protein
MTRDVSVTTGSAMSLLLSPLVVLMSITYGAGRQIG